MGKLIKIVSIFNPFSYQKMEACLPLKPVQEKAGKSIDELVENYHKAVKFAGNGVLIIKRAFPEDYEMSEETDLFRYARRTIGMNSLHITPKSSPNASYQYYSIRDFLRRKFLQNQLKSAKVYSLADTIEQAALELTSTQFYVSELNKVGIFPYGFFGFISDRDARQAIETYLRSLNVRKRGFSYMITENL